MYNNNNYNNSYLFYNKYTIWKSIFTKRFNIKIKRRIMPN